ncbi:MAG: hypothetical protein MI923_06605 [Phycisphaerales bacterium]|nr:hypothetical protein [Phycisphaerales bacterium]
MTTEDWRTCLRRVESRLHSANDVFVDENAAFVEDCAKLDSALRDGVLVETRSRVAAAHKQSREHLMDRVQAGEADHNEAPFTANRPIGGPFAVFLQHRTLTAAAVIAIAAGAWLMSISTNQTVGADTIYAQMLEKLQNITFKCESHNMTGLVPSVTKLYSGGNGLERIEFNAAGISFVTIFRDSKTYSFNPFRKAVRISPSIRAAETSVRFLDRMKANIDNESAESLGLRKIDGIECEVYRYEWVIDKPETPESESSILEIAIDAETQYPHRIAYLEYRRDPDTKAQLKERFEAVVVKNFEWDIELNPKLFDTSIPKGWTVQKPDDRREDQAGEDASPSADR